MEIACDLVSCCQAIYQQVKEAPSIVKVLGCTSGFFLATYGVYCVWFYRRFGRTRYVDSSVSLKGKTVLITGANAGIGRETAVDLAKRGARVIIASRNPRKAEDAAIQVRKRSKNDNVVFRQVDISDLNSVRGFAEEILRSEERLDILINNAGIVTLKECDTTAEGFDFVMGTNHVGHFVLTMHLIGLLKKSAPSRIVNVASWTHNLVKNLDYTNKSGKGLAGFDLYSRSKLANIHFTKELARRLEGTGVTSYAVHPGLVFTSIWQTTFTKSRLNYMNYILVPFFGLLMLDERAGAQTSIYCAIEESITHLSGRYFAKCSLTQESKLALDEQLAHQLWDLTCEATGIKPNAISEQV